MFHRAVGASDNLNVQETSHLIGVAFVPLKALIEGNGRTRTTGLYDVVSKNSVYQSIKSNTSLEAGPQTLGKIKVCVNASINIRKFMDNKEEFIENSKMSAFNSRFMPSPSTHQ